MDANQNLRAQFSSAMSSTLEDADAASKNLLSSIDRKCLVFGVQRLYYYLTAIGPTMYKSTIHSTETNACRFITTRS